MKLLSCICAGLLLTACGNRGALYLPEKRSAEVPAASTAGSTGESSGEATGNAKKKDLPPAKEP